MNFFRQNLPANRRSQIAVIITFVIAVILLFIAVFINLAKVSQVKTTASQAVDRSGLALASQLGSIGHYYKEKVLKISGPCTSPCQEKTIDGQRVIEVCSTDLISLAALIVILAAAGIVAFFAPVAYLAVGSIATVGAAAISMALLGGINTEFGKMTGYNAMRESALYQTLASTQSDDVELKSTGAGIFHDETTGQDYNLNVIPGINNERKVNRFFAWYYTKRLIFAGDDYLKGAVDAFKSGLLGGGIDVKRDSGGWNINALSYVIEPGPAEDKADYEITCTSSTCLPWVKNIALKQIAVIKIDATQPPGAQQIVDNSGFLSDKFLALAKRLEKSYGLSFCAKGTLGSIYCDDINFLMADLRDFLLKIKEVSDLPASYAYKNVTQWLPSFYDPRQHNFDRTAKGNCSASLDCDVYSRLTRDQNKINTWITELESLSNTRIIPDIKKPHGECSWGQGVPIAESRCFTEENVTMSVKYGKCDGGKRYISYNNDVYCFKSGGRWARNCSCEGPVNWTNTPPPYQCHTQISGQWPSYIYECCGEPISPCAWAGTYYTCCKNLPVCNDGDLYGKKPEWCDSRGDRANCPRLEKCRHGCSVKNFNCDGEAKNFQGQLAYNNTSGPNEVEQALKILRALNYNITQIKDVISDLADKVEFYSGHKGEKFTDANNNGVYDENENFTDLNGNGVYDSVFPAAINRDEIIYAWKDKQGFSHLARAKLEGYPERLPYVSESSEWGWFGPIPYPQKCRRLNAYQGDFKLTSWRYDQDQPTDVSGWNLRRRKSTPAEFDKTKLGYMVNDIQTNGKLTPTASAFWYSQGDIDDLLNHYAISSRVKARYGPDKSDIYIERLQ